MDDFLRVALLIEPFHISTNKFIKSAYYLLSEFDKIQQIWHTSNETFTINVTTPLGSYEFSTNDVSALCAKMNRTSPQPSHTVMPPPLTLSGA